ncbi:MAG: hypothetical protein GXX92_05580 [Clostridiales bacterium]|nr:hypothetical protein [Clostridiales bacterium]
MLKFILRFITVHVITYTAFGIFFMLISGYFEYFSSDPLFQLVMKESDALSVRLAIPAQIFRGALMALAIYPFREIVVSHRYGWLKLFFLLFILTSVGSVITGPGSIEGFLYTRFSFDPLIGYPEISLQMLAFSWLFCRWQISKIAKETEVQMQRKEVEQNE